MDFTEDERCQNRSAADIEGSAFFLKGLLAE
jgi:hypothetical protein